jgi:hypothetical protein
MGYSIDILLEICGNETADWSVLHRGRKEKAGAEPVAASKTATLRWSGHLSTQWQGGQMCAPIRFSGENFRKATAQDKLARLKNLMD